MSEPRIEATQYVLDGSWTCRRWRKHTCWLVRDAVEFLPAQPRAGDQVDDWRPRLAAHLRERVRGQRFGNPILIYILLYVVVPIVVRLVVEWWINRRKAPDG